MYREIRKAGVGFSSGKGEAIATGHWGCGAFGGDQEVKCLVQLIAASMAEVEKLDFYSFGDEIFSTRFRGLLKAAEGKTVDWLWQNVKEYRNTKIIKNKSILERCF